MQRSLDSLAGMATSAFGAGTSAAMRQATSPKTILEYIINFFTCGGVRRKNEAQYQELIDTMADTLKSSMSDRGAPLPENIILEDMGGFRVEFNLPGENNWICPYISRHLLSLNPLLACCRRYSRGER